VADTKPTKTKKGKEPKPKKVSAIDAAAQVLAASKDPMKCMATKGAESRFVMKDRGMFSKA